MPSAIKASRKVSSSAVSGCRPSGASSARVAPGSTMSRSSASRGLVRTELLVEVSVDVDVVVVAVVVSVTSDDSTVASPQAASPRAAAKTAAASAVRARPPLPVPFIAAPPRFRR